jgi:glycosyltransferase involved in cell wall biosynthesis
MGTNSSGTPEILDGGNCGVLVDADDAVNWPDAMEKMITHREEAHAVGQAAKRRFLENYSKEISVSRMKEIVDRCTSHEE